jgi:hypothetical protein
MQKNLKSKRHPIRHCQLSLATKQPTFIDGFGGPLCRYTLLNQKAKHGPDEDPRILHYIATYSRAPTHVTNQNETAPARINRRISWHVLSHLLGLVFFLNDV